MAGPTQSTFQDALRASTSTTGSWNSDWLAQFAKDGKTTGTWNERCLAWINAELVQSYTNLPQAQTAYAVAKGFRSWSDMNTTTGL